MSGKRTDDFEMQVLLKILRQIVKEHSGTILMDRWIMKHRLYKQMSWWFRYTREETRAALRAIVRTFPEIEMSNRGLKVPAAYLSLADAVEEVVEDVTRK